MISLIFTCLAMGAGAWLDSFQRTSVLMYDLEDNARAAYEAMTIAFDGLAGCAAKWHVDAGGAVRDIHTWKRNAGAGHLVDKRPTIFGYSLPRVVKSNVTPPAIKCGKETLYFLPDFLLVVESNKVGAVAYDSLSIGRRTATLSRMARCLPMPRFCGTHGSIRTRTAGRTGASRITIRYPSAATRASILPAQTV